MNATCVRFATLVGLIPLLGSLACIEEPDPTGCRADFECTSPRVCGEGTCVAPPEIDIGVALDSGCGLPSGTTVLACNCATDSRAIPSVVTATACCSGLADHVACVDEYGTPLYCCSGCGVQWANVCR